MLENDQTQKQDKLNEMTINRHIQLLPSCVHHKIYQDVCFLRKPRKVLTHCLSEDIKSTPWIKDIVTGVYKFYKSSEFALFWLESDLINHMNEYVCLTSTRSLSDEIRRHFARLTVDEIVLRVNDSNNSSTNVSCESRKSSVMRLWYNMSYKKRRTFYSKYTWINNSPGCSSVVSSKSSIVP